MSRWIHGLSRDLLCAAFCEYFGVSDEHADILIVLYGRPDESVPTRKMAALLNSHRPPKRGTIHERVRVLREIMEAESLDSGGQLDDSGYRLTEVGFEECRKAIHSMAEVMLRHGPAAVVNGRPIESLRAPEPQLAIEAPKQASAA